MVKGSSIHSRSFGEEATHFLHSQLSPYLTHHYHHNSTLKATVFAVIGFFVLLSILKRLRSLWRAVKLYVLAKPLGLGTRLDRLGEWAIVTGASDGIGKEYARQLAQRGLNVALVARNATKLDAVAKEIEAENPGRRTKTFIIDFARATRLDYRRLEEDLKALGNIGVLVNNVGLGFDVLARFHEYPDGEQLMVDMVNTNMTSAVMMCKMVIPGMLERHKGAIINIASVAGHLKPNAIFVIYPQTKLFLRAISEGLADEYESDGIIVQSVCPGLVRTNMAKGLIEQGGEFMANLMGVTPQSYVSYALSQVGVERETFGHPKHALTTWLSLDILPAWVNRRLMRSHLVTGEKLRAFAKKS